MAKYHWLSTSTGQIVEDFKELCHEILKSFKYLFFGENWTLRDELNYIFKWEYNREGF